MPERDPDQPGIGTRIDTFMGEFRVAILPVGVATGAWLALMLAWWALPMAMARRRGKRRKERREASPA